MSQNMFSSPFIIPVVGMLLALGIILISHVSNYYKQRLISEERLTALEKGLTLPPQEMEGFRPRDPWARINGIRTGGITTIAVGMGLMLFGWVLYWVTQERGTLVVAGAGLIPLCIGIGLLVDYRIQIRNFETAQHFARSSQPQV